MNLPEDSVFVTVGSTSFDKLIEFTNKPEFHAALWRLGYRNIVVQFGCGTVIPCVPSQSALERVDGVRECYSGDVCPLKLTCFRFKPSIADCINSSALVISHGGSGTCLQALRLNGGRRLIVVVNDSLSDNHQEEFAHELVVGKHALITHPEGLFELLWSGVTSDPRYTGLGLFENVPSDIVRFLGPAVTPKNVGFIEFPCGSPHRLIRYLNQRLGVV